MCLPLSRSVTSPWLGVSVRPKPDVELFMRRTKLVELSLLKSRRLNKFDRPTRSHPSTSDG